MDKQTKEILCITQEEAAEVVRAISKVFRFGMDNEWNNVANKTHLEEELGDMLAMIDILQEKGIVSGACLEAAKYAKIEKLKVWSNIFPKG